MAIKRSEELQPWSRQHHNGLLFCLLLQKGVKKNADLVVMQEFIQDFWFKDLHQHFDTEEQCLTPLINKYHQLVEPINRMIKEHYDLKGIINENSINISYRSVEDLSKSLEAHIRFEERELFPLIERTISEQHRLAIGHVLSHEKDDNCMNYRIKFWE